MWDVRGHHRYYYRHRLVDGRRVRVYVGTGPKAEEAAAEDLRRRAERKARRQALRAAEARLRAADVPVTDLEALVRLLTGAALTAAGVYQHDRGEWRRRGAPGGNKELKTEDQG
jgi:hypothetical protein